MVGSVSVDQYEQIVARLRDAVEKLPKSQFIIGDGALEVCPMQDHGGRSVGDDLFGVSAWLRRLSEDINVPYNTLRSYRWVASRWPEQQRCPGVAFSIHQTLAAISDDEERWKAIKTPPLDERTGMRRWTPETSRQRVGYHGPGPETAQEKIEAVHDLVADEQVATQVATDLLRRPSVAFKAMRDDTARHQVNHAQVEQARQLREMNEAELTGEPEPFAPAVRRINHALEFLDLVAACQRFVAATGRIVPSLRERPFSDDERDTVHRNVDRVRATCEWILTAVDTGQVDVDEELAKLLRGE
ncbi:RacO protein [Streptomyces sp. TRM66268-LWL]|uniref:RacO protein n=2 Tax=Streptomyces polyasparticus TaxID=2767826 RepID=A0ABR7STS8_9ACTN|nr:RacO protein [Streptomyces polyasparticus]